MAKAALDGQGLKDAGSVTPRGGGITYQLRNSGVGVGGQVWPMLLGGSHRNQPNPIAEIELGDLRRGLLAPPGHFVPVRVMRRGRSRYGRSRRGRGGSLRQ